MPAVEQLITGNLDVWSSAIKKRGSQGRGSSKKIELYGIKKLRELILELAFSGNLCPSSDSSVDYDDLLQKMEAEREDYHNKKGVRLQKFKLVADSRMEVTHPESWRSFYFNDVISYITDFQANGSFSSLKKNVAYYDSPNYALLVRLTDLRHGLSDNASYKYTDKLGYEFLSKSAVEGGELVVANVGAGVGTTLLVPKIQMPATLAPNMFMVVLSEHVNKEYFLHYSQSPQYLNYIKKVNTGTGQPKINKTEYKNCRIPVPSFSEQVQIAGKINELMALCDQLEQQQENSISAHQILVKTLLAALTNAGEKGEFNQAWARIAEHFDTLFTTEHSIDQLKQTILQLAVMGKLTQPEVSDSSVEQLIDRVMEEQINRGISTKEKALFEKEYCNYKTTIENNRVIVKARFFCDFITKGTTPSKNELVDNGKVPFLKVYNIVNNELDFDYKPIFVPEEVHQKKLKRSCVFPGDVIMNIVGPPLGKVAIINNQYPEWNMNQALAVFRPLAEISNRYLFYTLTTQSILKSVLGEVKGTAGQDNLSLEQCRDLLIPIPSLEEQVRIVDKLDELTLLCDSLKTRIKESQTTQLYLADAIAEQGLKKEVING